MKKKLSSEILELFLSSSMSAGQEVSPIINSSKLEYMSSSTNVTQPTGGKIYSRFNACFLWYANTYVVISCGYGVSAPGDGFFKPGKLSFRLTG